MMDLPDPSSTHRAMGAWLLAGALILLLSSTVDLGPAGPATPRPVSAQPANGTAPADTLERLDSGLELLVLPEPGHDLISVQVWYRVGTRDETADTAGIAHLLELLMFTGTTEVPDYNGTITELGGTYGSATWPDVTLFYTDVPATAVRRVLEIEADRMQHLTLPPDVVQASAESIAYAISRLVRDRPQAFVNDRLRALAFGRDHPYAHPLLRVPQASGVDLVERCRGFYEESYRPERACLIIAGAVDPDRVRRMVDEIFGDVAGAAAGAAEAPPRRPVPPIVPATDPRDVLDLGLGFPTVSIGYPVPGSADDEVTDAALRLLARFMDGPGRALWTTGLVDAAGRPQVIDVETHLLLDQQQGLLVLHGALTDPDVADQVEARILDNVASMSSALEARATPGATGADGDTATSDNAMTSGQAGGPSDNAAVLEDLRDRELLALFEQRRTTSARAAELGRAHLLRGDDTRYGRERELLQAVTWHDLARVAELLQPTRAATVQMRSEL
ncbi:MAG: pitrilysin family protein [Candidatus Eiseniibacteriota bacterium]|jgi:predicted Zn-dependent peptidase